MPVEYTVTNFLFQLHVPGMEKKNTFGALAVEITVGSGSLNAFREKFTEMALSVFGSGMFRLFKAGTLSRYDRQGTPVGVEGRFLV